MKTRIQKLILLISLFVLIISCTNKNKTIISGHFTSMDKWSENIYLSAIKDYDQIYLCSGKLYIDTVKIDKNGYFEFQFDSLPCTECLYRIEIRYKDHPDNPTLIRGLDENFIIFELREGVKLNINADATNLSRTFKINSQDDLWDYSRIHEQRMPANLVMDSVFHTLELAKNDTTINYDSLNYAEWDRYFDKLIENNKKLKKFILSSDNIYDKIVGIVEYDFDAEMDKHLNFYREVLDDLNATDSGHAFLRQYETDVLAFDSNVKKMDKAPNFSLPDKDGNEISFYDIEGDLILLDFWTSWCGPCRQEIKSTLIPLYKKYADMGFEVISVSMDDDKNEWLKALQEDDIKWTALIDKGKKSDLSKIYNVNAYPTTYLIRKNDYKILEEGIRGYELKLYIEKYFGI